MKNYGRPSNNRKIPNVFNKKQLIKIFDEIKEPELFMACLIALFCGLRVSEVCNLKKHDVDLESEKVIVRAGKGDKDRVVMLPVAVKPLIQDWFRIKKDEEYFITTSYKNKFVTNVVSSKFGKILSKAGLRIETFKTSVGQQRYSYSFHTLRHTYATYLLEKGVDLYYVQRSLGHVDIHTTQIYAYISNKDLQNKINKAFGKEKRATKETITKPEDPLQLLKIKFINDELTLEEFEQKYNAITKIEELF